MSSAASRLSVHDRRWSVTLQGANPGLCLSDVIVLIDAWVLLAVLWTARVAVGYLDFSVALGCAILFFTLTGTRAVPTRLEIPLFEDLKVIVARATVSFAVVAALATLTSVGDMTLLLYTLSAATASLVAARYAARAVQSKLRAGSATANALVIGAGEIARQIVSASQERGGHGLRVVGAVDDDPRYSSEQLGVDILGGLQDVSRVLREKEVRTLVVAFSQTNPGELVRIIRDAQSQGIAVWVVPRFFEMGRAGGAKELLWGLPLLRLTPPAHRHPHWRFKRVLDVVLAAAALIVAGPIMALCGLAVLIESGTPVLLRQQRVSRGGKTFTIFKFRTMRPIDESTERTEWAADPMRVTRVGRLLRDKSLDELPQLYNILKGDMSLVGPRPERPHFVDLFAEEHRHYQDRHRVPAGLTGWAQIHGLRGDDTSMDERIVFDNNYIDSWSLSEDVRIMARTVKTFLGQGK